MQNFQQMAANLNRQQMQQMKESHDLMNATMSRCYAAYLSQGKHPTQAISLAQDATLYFGKALGIIKEVNNEQPSGEDNNSTILRG